MINRIADEIINDYDEKIQALADFLEVDPSEISERYKNCYGYENKEYLVFTEDEAYDFAYEDVKNLIEDCGMECINGYERFIDWDYFYDDMKENYKSYCVNIKEESDNKFDNRLVKECYEEGIIDDDDFETVLDDDGNETDEIDYNYCLKDNDELIEEYTEYLCDTIDTQEYITGIYKTNEILKYFPNAVDEEALINYVIDTDGKGNVISSYDGKEYEKNGYLIYRVN